MVNFFLDLFEFNANIVRDKFWSKVLFIFTLLHIIVTVMKLYF